MTTIKLYLLCPREGRELCVCLYVCLSVCMSAGMSQKQHIQTLQNFLQTLPVAVAVSYTCDTATRYVLQGPNLQKKSYEKS